MTNGFALVGLVLSGCLMEPGQDACPEGSVQGVAGGCVSVQNECPDGLVNIVGLCIDPEEGDGDEEGFSSSVSDWEIPELGDTDDLGEFEENSSPVAALLQVTVEYSLGMTFEGELAESLCGMSGVCDCSNVYQGTGDQVIALGDEITFMGTWKLLYTDCVEDSGLDEVIWLPSDGDAYHSFRFAPTMTGLDDWVVHREAEDTTAHEDAMVHEQYWITAMDAEYDASGLESAYDTVEATVIQGLVPVTFTHHLAVRFAN